MLLENQIALMSNPQEFTRLYNAVLKAEHGDGFLEIDDDRPDRGNDGYLKSEKKLFAGHCFKRLQNQSIDQDIRDKMVGDLTKAITLKSSADWDIEAWTFVSNYPIPEAIGRDLLRRGKTAGIDVSWRGVSFIAELLQKHPYVRARFPLLEANEILEQLRQLKSTHGAPAVPVDWLSSDEYGAPTDEEINTVLTAREQLWEYRTFAGLMRKYRAALTTKLLDHEIGYAPRSAEYLDLHQASRRLNAALSDVSRVVDGINQIFGPSAQDKAFGAPGEHGSAARIAHLASRIVGCVEDLLTWAMSLRALGVPNAFVPVFDSAARLVDQPVSEILQFIDAYASMVVKLPSLLEQAAGEPVNVSQTLTLTLDSAALERFSAALRAAEEDLQGD